MRYLNLSRICYASMVPIFVMKSTYPRVRNARSLLPFVSKLEYYDEWKDTSIVRDLIRMLDNVLQYFIDNAPDTVAKASGLLNENGQLSLGQWVSIPYSKNTESLGNLIKHGKSTMLCSVTSSQESVRETEQLCHRTRRIPRWCRFRSTERASSCYCPQRFIRCYTVYVPKPSNPRKRMPIPTEPDRCFLVKNPYLEELLEEKGENNEPTWTSIITQKGSVQHLPFLNEGEKPCLRLHRN